MLIEIVNILSKNVLDKNKYNILLFSVVVLLTCSCGSFRNRGWAVYTGPKLDPLRYNSSNDGWAVDFSTNLNPNRFNRTGNGFYVMPRPNYGRIELSGSFNVPVKQVKGGTFFSAKEKRVKNRRLKKPVTNDSFAGTTERREYNQNVYSRRHRRVIKNNHPQNHNPYKKLKKRKKNMNLDLFPFQTRGNT